MKCLRYTHSVSWRFFSTCGRVSILLKNGASTNMVGHRKSVQNHCYHPMRLTACLDNLKMNMFLWRSSLTTGKFKIESAWNIYLLCISIWRCLDSASVTQLFLLSIFCLHSDYISVVNSHWITILIWHFRSLYIISQFPDTSPHQPPSP